MPAQATPQAVELAAQVEPPDIFDDLGAEYDEDDKQTTWRRMQMIIASNSAASKKRFCNAALFEVAIMCILLHVGLLCILIIFCIKIRCMLMFLYSMIESAADVSVGNLQQ